MAGVVLHDEKLERCRNLIPSDVIRGAVFVEVVEHVLKCCITPAGKCFGTSSLSWGWATRHGGSAVCIRAGHVRGQIQIEDLRTVLVEEKDVLNS